MDESLWDESFIIVETPHKKRISGFPLDSLSTEIKSGRYYFDIELEKAIESNVDRGFKDFFKYVSKLF